MTGMIYMPIEYASEVKRGAHQTLVRGRWCYDVTDVCHTYPSASGARDVKLRTMLNASEQGERRTHEHLHHSADTMLTGGEHGR